MITRYRKKHRLIATIFLLIFFPTLVPNNLFASNNGPKSPEAASFEPVDATDMVNLITGQYSYVLPLLNVPSPEGGYPIALGYHAGIAMDQESSWTGLGWNVNPGAINRNVNGYPDDYNASHLNEYFYDSGGTIERYSISMGFTSLQGASVGLNFNWGSDQALGGSVSIGYGPKIGESGITAGVTAGTDGASVGIGFSAGAGLSYGASVSSNGDVGINAGFNSNGNGFSVGYNTNGSTSVGLNTGSGNNSFALDFTLSSNGIGVTGNVTNRTGKNIDGGAGLGMFVSFNNNISMGDYNTSSSGWMIPIIVPTAIGIFSLSFGKQTFKYWMSKNENNSVSGPIYFNKGVQNLTTTYQVWVPLNSHELQDGRWETRTRTTATNGFMDITETPILNSELSKNSNALNNNIDFPSYDRYNIQAQGLSGSMSPTLYENGALFGLPGKENKEGYRLNYSTQLTNTSAIPEYAKFDNKPIFYLDNEISSYLNTNVPDAVFNTSLSNTNILNHYTNGVETAAKQRRRTSTFVEYFTNNEIITNNTILKQNGFLEGGFIGTERSTLPKNGIGAIKITTVDGKTYHYSLPVLNHEVITRTFGVIPERPNESQSYFEKRQLEPFATHWLLTAVTGSDFVDNGDGVAGNGDLGYWTSFEYGKWTDAFIWKSPYKKDYINDDSDPNIKTWIRGRKQLYYLDKVKTRSHTALFIKSERVDAPSEKWSYFSVNHLEGAGPNNNPYIDRFTVPSQKQLQLDKIILLKNIDDSTSKTFGLDNNQYVQIGYPNSEKSLETAKYNMFDNILDSNDNWQGCISKAVKVIDFSYDNSLVPGDNRLTLKSVDFKGKGAASVLPPYKFDYINDSNTFNIDNKDGWGYPLSKPETFSLNKITTPQGGTINIGYESNKFISITPHEIEFKNTDNNYTLDNVVVDGSNKMTFDIKSSNNFGIQIGSILKLKYEVKKLCSVGRDDSGRSIMEYINVRSCYGNAIVIQNFGNNKYKVKSISDVMTSSCYYGFGDTFISAKYILGNIPTSDGGPRVASLKVSDGINNFITDYKYGQNEDGVGYVSYVPYSQNVAKEVPYSAELPAPRVMYEYVSMSSHKEGVLPEGKIRYKFNVMKSKDPNKIKYGDFYEIVETKQNPTTNSSNIDVNISSFVVKDNLASIGQLLEVATFNGKGQQLSKISNAYYGMDDNTTNMGVSKESYQTYKTVDYLTNTSTIKDKWIINSSTRIKYPNIMKFSTERKDGYTYTTQFNDYDLISGVSKEQVYTSSTGQTFKTKSIPAYIKYPQMGSKVDNPTNKNMLSQTAAEYSYILDKPSNTWKVTGVGITTWNNLWNYRDIAGEVSSPSAINQKIWRKHKSYTWNGAKDSDGIFLNYGGIDDNFNWDLPTGVGIDVNQPVQWKQISETTLYDHFSAPLEMKDINGNKASSKMGDNETKIMVTGNAGYNEMFYSGVENTTDVLGVKWLEPDVKMANAKTTTLYAHSGKLSVEATSSSEFGVFMKGNEHKAGKYKVSVWVHKSAAVNAGLYVNSSYVYFTSSNTAGDWVLKSAVVHVGSSDCSINVKSLNSTVVYLDDLMIRPVASTISGYVYNEWDELIHIIGNNGLATRFEYDGAGRLIKTYSEVLDDPENNIIGGFKLSKTNKYNNKYL